MEISQSFHYAGYLYDSETGLYYLINRYYDPGIGRFISKDPRTVISPPDSLGANPYLYVRNNPVNRTDPDGLGPTGTLFGRVMNTAGSPIVGTAVRYGNIAISGGNYILPGNANVMGTNPAGEYRFTLETGIYHLYFDAGGYVSQKQEYHAVWPGQETVAPTVIMSPAPAPQPSSGSTTQPAPSPSQPAPTQPAPAPTPQPLPPSPTPTLQLKYFGIRVETDVPTQIATLIYELGGSVSYWGSGVLIVRERARSVEIVTPQGSYSIDYRGYMKGATRVGNWYLVKGYEVAGPYWGIEQRYSYSAQFIHMAYKSMVAIRINTYLLRPPEPESYPWPFPYPLPVPYPIPI